MQDRLREFAKSFGIDDMKLRERSPNTRRALAIAEYAREQGKLEAWRKLAMDAHWRRGMDLEAERDLRALAAEAGLDPDAAIAASTSPAYLERIDQRRREAEEVGVTGIPTFVIGDQGVVGCQPYDVLARFVESAGARKRQSTA
jgi:predicted DsbA family dithiol-disulfide isomerase